jgi:hypothetical protein
MSDELPRKPDIVGGERKTDWDIDWTTERQHGYLEEASARITAIYEAGTPFFTKATFQRLVELADQPHESSTEEPRLILTGLDGVDVEYTLVTGTVYHDYHYDIAHPERELVRYVILQRKVYISSFIRTRTSSRYANLDQIQTSDGLPLCRPHVEEC